MGIPTTIVSGHLGVGKTSAVLSLAEHQPPGKRWVVLVNEIGEVGIDGALLAGASDLAVHELAGGCLCCTGRGPMRASLVSVLARTKPDRLIIEPSGAADLGPVLDLVTRDFADQLTARATITLVDPRAVDGPRRTAWKQQVDAADVLVANKIDLCDGATVQRFLAWAAALFPPKQRIVTTVGGELDPAWLELSPGGAATAAHFVDQTRLLPPQLGNIVRPVAPGHGLQHQGWRWPPDQQFLAMRLEAVAGQLAEPGDLLPDGAVRIKGVFHTDRGWRSLQADADGVRWAPTSWRGDSRLEVIVDGSPALGWAPVLKSLDAARIP